MVNPQKKKARLLIFIVAYNAEQTIEHVLQRIPQDLSVYDTEILIIDDASGDATFETAQTARLQGISPFKLTVLKNPVNQKYGGNQKIGYHYAIEKGFDFVALVHGDGQYAPEALPRLVEPLANGEADAVFGSRMMSLTGALKGGMPLYKYVGNRILTFFQNRVLGSSLSEFHTGYRIYSTEALKRIPFQLNTEDFHFDTEIIIQLILAGLRIKELPIPTFYGDEICHVDGMKYAVDVAKATSTAKLQSFCLMYRRNYDVQPAETDSWSHKPKLDFDSSQTRTLQLVEDDSKVLMFGGDSAEDLAPHLADKGCQITILDKSKPESKLALTGISQHDERIRFLVHDPDKDRKLPLALREHDYVLMLDVIEQSRSPERFLEQLKESLLYNSRARVIVCAANIGFFVPRIMLLCGQFNYARKGILNLDHTRLFTFSSMRRLLEESGFRIELEDGIPAPYPLVVSNEILANTLIRINRFLIKLGKGLFSYQLLMVARPQPTLPALLENAYEHSRLCMAEFESNLPENENLHSSGLNNGARTSKN